MTFKQDFIDELDEKGYKYRIVDESVVVVESEDVDLDITIIPDNTRFCSGGNITLPNAEVIGNNVSFENSGFVSLPSATSLGRDMNFYNKGSVSLDKASLLPVSIFFRNTEDVKIGNYKIDLKFEEIFLNDYNFKNGGNVDLGVNNPALKKNKLYSFDTYYQNKAVIFALLNNECFLVKDKEKDKNDVILYKDVVRFGGGKIEDLPSITLAKKDDVCVAGIDTEEAKSALYSILDESKQEKEPISSRPACTMKTTGGYNFLEIKKINPEHYVLYGGDTAYPAIAKSFPNMKKAQEAFHRLDDFIIEEGIDHKLTREDIAVFNFREADSQLTPNSTILREVFPLGEGSDTKMMNDITEGLDSLYAIEKYGVRHLWEGKLSDNEPFSKKEKALIFSSIIDKHKEVIAEALFLLQTDASKNNGLNSDSPSVLSYLPQELNDGLRKLGGETIDRKDMAKIVGLESSGITSIYDIPAREETALLVKFSPENNFTVLTGNYNQEASNEVYSMLEQTLSGDFITLPHQLKVGLTSDELNDYRSLSNMSPEFLDMDNFDSSFLKLTEASEDKKSSVAFLVEEDVLAIYMDVKNTNNLYIIQDNDIEDGFMVRVDVGEDGGVTSVHPSLPLSDVSYSLVDSGFKEDNSANIKEKQDKDSTKVKSKEKKDGDKKAMGSKIVM